MSHQTSILSSPFLNLTVINQLLSSPDEAPPELRVQLLSAKVHLLTESLAKQIATSTAARRSKTESIDTTSASFGEVSSDCKKKERSGGDGRMKAEAEILRVRLDLGRAYLALPSPEIHAAETELGVVEKDSKGMLKRLGKRGKDDGSRSRSIGDDDGSSQGKGAGMGHPGVIEDSHSLAELSRLRIEVLNELVRVEEMLGRESRADRWRKAIDEAQKDNRTAGSGE